MAERLEIALKKRFIEIVTEKPENLVTSGELEICISEAVTTRGRTRMNLRHAGYLDSVIDKMFDLGFEEMVKMRAQKRRTENGGE